MSSSSPRIDMVRSVPLFIRRGSCFSKMRIARSMSSGVNAAVRRTSGSSWNARNTTAASASGTPTNTRNSRDSRSFFILRRRNAIRLVATVARAHSGDNAVYCGASEGGPCGAIRGPRPLPGPPWRSQQARAAIGRIFYQRCFYLFLVLLALIVGVPFIEPTPAGRFLVNVTGTAVVIAAVATVGRTRLSFIIAFLLAIPAAIFHWFGMSIDDPHYLFLSACFGAGLYAMTLAYLLRYVFERDVITADRLFGAASAYLIIGVLWAYLFAIVGYVYPESFAIGGAAAALATYDYLYFSFTALTSTGFGDITPLSRQARSLCVVRAAHRHALPRDPDRPSRGRLSADGSEVQG